MIFLIVRLPCEIHGTEDIQPRRHPWFLSPLSPYSLRPTAYCEIATDLWLLKCPSRLYGSLFFFIFNHPLRSRHKVRKENPLPNRNGRFDKPFNPSGISIEPFTTTVFSIFAAKYLWPNIQHTLLRKIIQEDIDCPQGMMIYLIGTCRGEARRAKTGPRSGKKINPSCPSCLSGSYFLFKTRRQVRKELS